LFCIVIPSVSAGSHSLNQESLNKKPWLKNGEKFGLQIQNHQPKSLLRLKAKRNRLHGLEIGLLILRKEEVENEKSTSHPASGG
jgi:hypothetical protein